MNKSAFLISAITSSACFRSALCLAGVLGLAHCAGAPSDPQAEEESTATAQGAVIGGVDAKSARLDAIGALAVKSFYGQAYDAFCGATLISRTTVVTAKHCAQYIKANAADGMFYFLVGWDTKNPKQAAEIVQVEMAPGDIGGFVGMGSDVAVLHLENPVSDVTPLRVARLDDSHIGRRFSALGYGWQDNNLTFGTRKAGSITLRALEGRAFEHMYGSFNGFRKAMQDRGLYGAGTVGNCLDAFPTLADAQASEGAGAGEPSSVGGAGGDAGDAGDGGVGGVGGDGGVGGSGGYYDWDDYWRSVYETTLLLERYDAFLGGVPRDAQPCKGDSGSPILAREGSELVVYGVASGGVPSPNLVCDHGVVYATFGEDTIAFLQNAAKWIDSCDEITRTGVCEGDIALRCTGMQEGTRRLVENDCGILMQTCGTGTDGVVECRNPVEPGACSLSVGTPSTDACIAEFCEAPCVSCQDDANCKALVECQANGGTSCLEEFGDGIPLLTDLDMCRGNNSCW